MFFWSSRQGHKCDFTLIWIMMAAFILAGAGTGNPLLLAGTSGLDVNESLLPGQTLTSPDGSYVFAHQLDGNVVLYSGYVALWASNTGGTQTTTLVMQADGNLVLYNGGQAVWASNTGGLGASRLAVQNDGNVVIYRISDGIAIWSTGTGSSAKSYKVGVTHVAGLYNFTNKDYLTEGADRIQHEIRSHVIKLWLNHQYKQKYPFNSNWPTVTNLTDLVKTPYYKNVINRPHFTTIVFEALEFYGGECSWTDGDFSAADYQQVFDEHYNLAVYLLLTYKRTGKTFILQNWESDNAMGRNSSWEKRNAMVNWLNCRQDAINTAKANAGMVGVKVVGAMEVNIITGEWSGEKAINAVVPYTHMDLYSYSNYETGKDKNALKVNLTALAGKAPDSALYGSKNIFLGEYGWPENPPGGTGEIDQRDLVKNQTEAALTWGVKYVIYWEIYDNDGRGFWLIRPDGSYPLVYYYLKSLM